MTKRNLNIALSALSIKVDVACYEDSQAIYTNGGDSPLLPIASYKYCYHVIFQT